MILPKPLLLGLDCWSHLAVNIEHDQAREDVSWGEPAVWKKFYIMLKLQSLRWIVAIEHKRCCINNDGQKPWVCISPLPSLAMFYSHEWGWIDKSLVYPNSSGQFKFLSRPASRLHLLKWETPALKFAKCWKNNLLFLQTPQPYVQMKCLQHSNYFYIKVQKFTRHMRSKVKSSIISLPTLCQWLSWSLWGKRCRCPVPGNQFQAIFGKTTNI